MVYGAATVTAVYALSTATAVPLGYAIWRHRDETGALPLLGSIVGGGIWSLSLFAAAVTSNYARTLLIERIHYVGVGLAVASVFLFALEYTGREHLVTRRTVGLLAVQPIAVLVLAFTNPGNVFSRRCRPTPPRSSASRGSGGSPSGFTSSTPTRSCSPRPPSSSRCSTGRARSTGGRSRS